MQLDTKSPIVPAMIKSWIGEMLDMKQNAQSRENRYLMLEYTHRVIGEALKKYEARK